ncbi:serine/threonine protein kinase [Paenibacillus thermoaerophilus]|uniref:Serine/threonine protein kinase n=1 Tax=Paenibacillus thermoaerophilus TaxID=1215385 RepID=A0ABW2V7Y7_9BACL|nr:protein kinase family protein [Paenibacillus thermoaerophilus]TMV17864.1 protein kinase family protein [Paenibacillus thermoaerophilus]
MRGRKGNRFARLLASLLDRPLPPGTRLAGRYELVEPLGMGSYGLSYLARDIGDGTLCVLKTDRLSRRWRRRPPSSLPAEAEALRACRHERVPRLLGLFRERGRWWIAMERKAGPTLESLLIEDAVRFTEAEALAFAWDVALLVKELHSRGYVHRDVRPPNLVLVPPGDGDAAGAGSAFRYGRAHLIDFGLARIIGSEPEKAGADTDVPEEKRLRRECAPRADWYALGHLLLFLLYSSYPGAPGDEPPAGESPDPGWERELELLPQTRRLLKRLLQSERAYESWPALEEDWQAALLASSCGVSSQS